MKSREVYSELGRRERQLMEIVYRRGQATATEIRDELPDPPSYSAVRGMLRLLEDKGYLRHEQEGPRYVYSATASRNNVSKSAVRDLVRTFFDDSASSAVAAMIGQYEGQLSEAELDRLEQLIERARAAERKNTKGGRS
jgi:predicted transcriptional regulator